MQARAMITMRRSVAKVRVTVFSLLSTFPNWLIFLDVRLDVYSSRWHRDILRALSPNLDIRVNLHEPELESGADETIDEARWS
jgi:hypothetical protein